MGRYFLIDHPADIAVKIEAGSLDELFIHAAEALKHILIGDSKLKRSEIRSLKLTGKDAEELLVNFLSELNYLISENKYFFQQINDLKIQNLKSDMALSCELAGTTTIENTTKILEEIKAVTYHKLGIEKTKNGFSTLIIFDV